MSDPVKFWKDKSKRLERMAAPIIKKDFPNLQHVKILWTWRNKARDDGEGNMVFGACRVLPTNLRDVFGYDFQIEVSADIWQGTNKKGRHRLVWHELRHCQVVMEEDEPEKDDADRVKCFMEPHDLQVHTFRNEIKKFGMSRSDVKVAKFLLKQLKKGHVSKLKLPDDTVLDAS